MNTRPESLDRIEWDGNFVTKICGLCLLLNWSMWKLGRAKWIAATYFVAFALMLLGTVLAAIVPLFGLAAALGFNALRIWMIAAAVLMLCWKPIVQDR